MIITLTKLLIVAVLAPWGTITLLADSRLHANNAPPLIELPDQFGVSQRLSFPTDKITVLAIADRKCSEQVDSWILPLKRRYENRVALRGMANLEGAPSFLRGRISKHFREERSYPVMMDWSGKICPQLGAKPGVVSVLVLGFDGRVHARFEGAGSEHSIKDCLGVLDRLLAAD